MAAIQALRTLASPRALSPPRVRLTDRPRVVVCRDRIGKVLMALGATTSSAAVSSMEEAVQPDRKSQDAQAAGEAELMTEYMVDMKCEGCVKSVKSKLEPLEGVRSVDVDLSNQVVRILGTASIRSMSAALEQTGRAARMIGQGSLEEFGTAAAVAEFKGPQIYGVVRFAQVNMRLARVEANFSGLSPGRHAWSINNYGDLTRGASSTGGIFNPQHTQEAIGDLGVLEADDSGHAAFAGTKQELKVADLIGRAVVVYPSADKTVDGVAAAVIARSAGVGENYKKLCTCDGTVIWES